MYNTRIQFAMDYFIEEKYFLPTKNYYELCENTESGKSLLKVNVEGENICVEGYDGKRRCNFLRPESKFGMHKCIDHFILKNDCDYWDLYMIEMKSSVGNPKWLDIKAKMRSSLLNIKALCEFLGIKINKIYTYTTYERECFETVENTTNPKSLISPLGEKATNFKLDEWDKDVIKFKIDEIVTLPHTSIKMERDEKIGLYGTLNI